MKLNLGAKTHTLYINVADKAFLREYLQKNEISLTKIFSLGIEKLKEIK